MTMITGKFILKAIVVAGSSVYCGNLFALVVPESQGVLAKGVSTAAGVALGGYLGINVANGLDAMITDAKRKVDAQKEHESESEVKVNG